jgi:hypothetical protein
MSARRRLSSPIAGNYLKKRILLIEIPFCHDERTSSSKDTRSQTGQKLTRIIETKR